MTASVQAAIQAGDELPSLVKGPVSRQMLVEWCAAENDYFHLHYDERVAKAMQLPGPPIQGTFRYAMMGQMVQHWLNGLPGGGTLSRITASYRGLNLEGDIISARGKVVATEPAGEGRKVSLEVWIENDQGVRSTTGEATVLLPGGGVISV